MSKRKEIIDVVLLGRKIGTATGWDMHDTFVFGFYDFDPIKGVALPSGQASVDFSTGRFSTFGDDGEETASVDLATAISSLPIEA